MPAIRRTSPTGRAATRTSRPQLAPSEEVKEAALDAPIEVKQVTVTQFPLLETDGSQQMRVDRCQSCHIGLENPQMTAENIIKAVDGVALTADKIADYLDAHPETRSLVTTIGAHPGIDIEGTGAAQDLGIVHSRLLSYGVTAQAARRRTTRRPTRWTRPTSSSIRSRPSAVPPATTGRGATWCRTRRTAPSRSR